MLADNLKMPLLRLTSYASETDYAVSHLKMTFNNKNNSSNVEADFSPAAERSELSNIQSEAIGGLFDQLLNELKNSFQGLPLEKIIFEADVNLLGIDNQSMKITCRFDAKAIDDKSEFIEKLLNAAVKHYEMNQSMEHAATNLVLILKRSKLQFLDLVFDNTIPDDSFYQIPFSKKVINAFSALISNYEDISMNLAPALVLNFALTQRKSLQFLTGSAELRSRMQFNKGTFEINSVEEVLAQLNLALDLVQTAHISGITLISHGRGYIPNFDLTTKQTSLDSAGTIDLNHEIAQTYQYIFKMMINNYSFPSFSKNWSQAIKCTLKMQNGKYVIDFNGYQLSKGFVSESIEQVKSILRAKAVLFDNKAQIKEVSLTTKEGNVVKAVMTIDALDKHLNQSTGMHITDTEYDDPQATITRTFRLTPKGYVFEKERFVD